jgi:CheY-like chemotaxis protein
MRKGVILFADNAPRFIDVRREFLEREGYQVVGANSPDEAKRILEEGRVDLAILDIRMVNDDDDGDISGLNLAKETARDVPKIILTGFPTWDAVKEALGPDLNGVPAAVDFIAKQEGSEAMLRAVELNLRRPQLRANLLEKFEVISLMALPQRVVDLGPEEASTRFQKSFEDTSRELAQRRERESRWVARQHSWGQTTAVLSLLLVVVGAILVLLGYANESAFTLVASTLAKVASLLFFRREEKAHARVRADFAQLGELSNLGHLLMICDSLQNPLDREEYKKKLIDSVIHRWFEE